MDVQLLPNKYVCIQKYTNLFVELKFNKEFKQV